MAGALVLAVFVESPTLIPLWQGQSTSLYYTVSPELVNYQVCVLVVLLDKAEVG